MKARAPSTGVARSRQWFERWLGSDSLATALVIGGTSMAILVQLRATPLVPGTGTVTVIGHATAVLMLVAGVILAKDDALGGWPQLGRREAQATTTIGQVIARAAEARDGDRPRTIRWPVLAASGMLGLATFILTGGNRFTPLNVTTWALSVVTFVAATWVSSARSPTGDPLVARFAGIPQALGLAGTQRRRHRRPRVGLFVGRGASAGEPRDHDPTSPLRPSSARPQRQPQVPRHERQPLGDLQLVPRVRLDLEAVEDAREDEDGLVERELEIGRAHV